MPIAPGDVLLTRTKGGFSSMMIRLGAAIRDQPNMVNHVAVLHHKDDKGTWWVLEGRPGGVGWRDARDYLNSPYTVNNGKQPKTDAQRATITKQATAMIGTPYDWDGIAEDAATALNLDKLWAPSRQWSNQVPGHVVCSSLAAYLYGKAGVECPTGARTVTPANWLDFIIRNKFEGDNTI